MGRSTIDTSSIRFTHPSTIDTSSIRFTHPSTIDTSSIGFTHPSTIDTSSIGFTHPSTIDTSSIRFTHPSTIDSRWMKVEGQANYTTGDDKIPIGVYTVYSVKDEPFGCYLYGMSNWTIYMHPVGYTTTHINYICNSTLLSMKPGDGIDNECDENIDEEEKDGKDNDQDSKIDEDLMAAVNGGWGAWSEWFCPRLCENGTYLEHTRKCNNPPPKSGGVECIGEPAESNMNITCKGTDKICPSECRRGAYGLSCEGDCRNCEDDCEKINGSCQQCKLGFSGPERGCTKTCPPLSYGYACRGSCLEKCGEECLDTINGECPETNHLQNIFLILLLLPPVYLIYICIRRCTKKDIPPAVSNSALTDNHSSDQSIHFFDPKSMLKRMQSRSTDVTSDITTETVETTTTWTEDKTVTEAYPKHDNGNIFLV
ncbi:hypothetical protein Btru_037564 [Bulinus truncatus]|nr:hypothetical protein Btru_037564 [Bulinus truncatus]